MVTRAVSGVSRKAARPASLRWRSAADVSALRTLRGGGRLGGWSTHRRGSPRWRWEDGLGQPVMFVWMSDLGAGRAEFLFSRIVAQVQPALAQAGVVEAIHADWRPPSAGVPIFLGLASVPCF